MLRNSLGIIKNTINKIASNSSPYHFTYANLKSLADSLSSLCSRDKQIIDLDNDYDNYEGAYNSIEISKNKKISDHLIFLALVSFHQKKGSVIECTFPKRENLQKNPIIKTLFNLKFNNEKNILDDLFNQLTNYALTDGIHLVNKDTEFFFIHSYQKPLYCLSHYVQIKTVIDESNNSSTIDDFQENERNCIQKALCVVSTIPLFGNSIIYQNFYTQLVNQMDSFMSQQSLNDKSNLDILYNNLLQINDTENDQWMFNLRKLYCYLKEDIFTLVKLILLEKRIIVYSQIPSNVSMFIISLLSLLPGEISQTLLKAHSQNGMPFKVFHDKYLIYPLFSLFDLDPLLSKIAANKSINFFIGTTNSMVSNSKKIVYSCKIDLDKPEIKYDKKSISSNITTPNDVEEKQSNIISNFVEKNIKNEGGIYLSNKKCCIKDEWLIPKDNEKHLEENKLIKKVITNYIFSIIADISYINKELKNKDNYKEINPDIFPLYDIISNNYNKYMNNSSDSNKKNQKVMQKTNETKKLEKILHLEEITSEPLYNIVNTILSFNKINSKVVTGSTKYQGLESLIEKPNNLEFLVDWVKTKNFKKWYCSYDEILTNLSIFNLDKINIKIYDFENNYYWGHLINGKKTGEAKVKYYDGDLKYVGNFKNNLREGKGNITSSDNKYMYDGTWKNDKYDGEGALLSPQLGKYTGFFKDGLFDGKGFLIAPDNSSYNGKFVRGEKSGEGEYKMSNGYVYIGSFKNDLYHGMGKLYDNNKKIIQEGKFVKGELVNQKAK